MTAPSARMAMAPTHKSRHVYPECPKLELESRMDQVEPREPNRDDLRDHAHLRSGLTPVEAASQLRIWIVEGNNYSRLRKQSFRGWSSALRVASLTMSAAGRSYLGLRDLNFWAGVGFSLVALTTVRNGSEAFFNWRSRWVFAEEAKHRFYRLQDDLDYLVAKRPVDSRSAVEAAERHDSCRPRGDGLTHLPRRERP